MIILGINAYHGDSSACLVINGMLMAAAEEERFSRVKHWAGLPIQAIAYCLKVGNLSLYEVDVIAINRNPQAHLVRKLLYGIQARPNFARLVDRIRNRKKLKSLGDELAASFQLESSRLDSKIQYIEHHLAHLGSAFFVSPFDEAAVISVDGFGDFASTLWGIGKQHEIAIRERVFFPHSLGIFYLAITQYLGFNQYGDEYKVMGLAPYGEPTELQAMRNIVTLGPNGSFSLNLDYFQHHTKGVAMTWEGGEPKISQIFTEKLEDMLGPKRQKDEAPSQNHKNIAASAQSMYEEAFFHLLNYVQEKTGQFNLALAGGCALNSVANGKIFSNTKFKDVYIQSAAGDAGGAIGAAFVVWNQLYKMPRNFVMEHSYWGPDYSNAEIKKLIDKNLSRLSVNEFSISHITSEIDITKLVAKAISEGKVIGWFQGRMEWGPRALGNRSILGDPRRADMKDILNLKIKRRESFRPFAPSILREHVGEWFETDYDVPFMMQVFQINEEKKKLIPAVTHVNGSGRLQTVRKEQNNRYYNLINSFYELTGVPILLNTSFNENEPVVCQPEEALNCFLRTKMDILVMNDYVIERKV
ncbi:carbamoyltransferase [Polynucleobacter sp. HIN8]|uniref:carbamoyltransferase family protein n=1 Tax=Polynucleobacter sp. HIN8 TaxID=3047867 RepID=UPI0025741529|nr:carbamoyltransferase C-terminal domain-containing protein [Polynucleobacter sp. HIN8]BEI38381.1 carbamoyltransferase [Polynucleobacter sp. HIN8]